MGGHTEVCVCVCVCACMFVCSGVSASSEGSQHPDSVLGESRPELSDGALTRAKALRGVLR